LDHLMNASTPRPAIVVTGASMGIGRALALEAAGKGVAMLLVARSREPLEVLAGELGAKGTEAHVCVLDVTQADAPAALDAALLVHGLHCDVLINNAGIGHIGRAAEIGLDRQMAAVDLNVAAATRLALHVLPGMITRQRGGILNVGSVAGFMPGPGMAVYYATKAYLRSLSEALWEESRRHGVTISCLAPGPVETAFLDKAGARSSALFGGGFSMDAAQCARIGWAGFRAGRRMIVPGWRNKLSVTLAGLAPRSLLLTMVRRLQKARAG
jgi:uncharacterized protein